MLSARPARGLPRPPRYPARPCAARPTIPTHASARPATAAPFCSRSCHPHASARSSYPSSQSISEAGQAQSWTNNTCTQDAAECPMPHSLSTPRARAEQNAKDRAASLPQAAREYRSHSLFFPQKHRRAGSARPFRAHAPTIQDNNPPERARARGSKSRHNSQASRRKK